MRSRILIAGLPKTGKTTLALRLGNSLSIPVRHADELNKTHAWSAQSLEVAAWMGVRSPWIIEGVTVVRAIRKWMNSSRDKPADVIYWGSEPYLPLDDNQRRLGAGCATIWSGLLTELGKRNVEIRQVR